MKNMREKAQKGNRNWQTAPLMQQKWGGETKQEMKKACQWGKKISTATQELKKDSFKKATVNSYKYCREKKEEM